MHKRNVFKQMSELGQNEREYLDNLFAQRIDPVTGEAHYYFGYVKRTHSHYEIWVPRNEHTKSQFPLLENSDKVKVTVQREKDKYVFITEVST